MLLDARTASWPLARKCTLDDEMISFASMLESVHVITKLTNWLDSILGLLYHSSSRYGIELISDNRPIWWQRACKRVCLCVLVMANEAFVNRLHL